MCLIWCLIVKGNLYFSGEMVGCGSKNRHQKDMHCKDIELQIQDLLTLLDAIVNRIGGTYVII